MINKNIYIDLHLHLDGSLSRENYKSLARACNFPYPEDDNEVDKLLIAPDYCKTLNDYLAVFVHPLKVLQTKENITNAIKTLTSELKETGLVYVEIRFAPSLHCEKGLTQEEVIKAAIQGAKEASIKTKLILCCMRGTDDKINLETVELAKKYLGEYVVALDLAGAEGLYETCTFNKVFKRAKELNIPFTIHAGESDGPSSVISALDFGAARIGHGVRAIEDKDLLSRLANNHILLEVCPKSESQTKAIPSLEALPLKLFDEYKIPYTICSDDMAVSATNVKMEYDTVQRIFKYSDEEILNMVITGLKYCFASDNEKDELIALVKENFNK